MTAEAVRNPPGTIIAPFGPQNTIERISLWDTQAASLPDAS